MTNRTIYCLCLITIIVMGIFIYDFSYPMNTIGITQEIYIALCGVWDTRRVYDTMEQLSWGKSKTAVNGSTIIDLGAEPPTFFTGAMGISEIKNVYKEKDKYVIRILFRDGNNYNLEIQLINKDVIVFNEMKWFKQVRLLDKYGKTNKYIKIDGPKIKYYRPKINNLRLRSEQSTDSKIIKILHTQDKLLLLKTGKEEVLKGVKGTWIKIITDQNEIGWCFNSYVE